jgi:hypothetical protein
VSIYITWAQDRRCRLLAEALEGWLPRVVPGVRTWMAWSGDGADPERSPQAVRLAILCVTPPTLSSRLLPLEALMLVRPPGKPAVYVYLLGEPPPGGVTGPLASFTVLRAIEADTRRLVMEIAATLDPAPPADVVTRQFEQQWQDLDAALSTLPPPTETPEPDRAQHMAGLLGALKSRASPMIPADWKAKQAAIQATVLDSMIDAAREAGKDPAELLSSDRLPPDLRNRLEARLAEREGKK